MENHTKKFAISVIFFFLFLTGSAFAYHFAEGWTYLDSVYFVVISATTIGYGDVVPITNLGKIVTIVFSFFWIAFAFYYVSLISSYVFKRHLGRKRIETYESPSYKKSGPKKPGPARKNKNH